MESRAKRRSGKRRTQNYGRGSPIAIENNSPIGTSQGLQDAELLRLALEQDFVDLARQSPGPPILVALSGLPGTGKSHFARKLGKKLPFLVFESDRVRKLLLAKPRYSRGEHERVFRVCHLLIEEYLTRGYRVLFDAANLTEAFRQPLYAICQRVGVPLVLVKFSAPRQVVRERLEHRSEGLDPATYSDANWLIYCRMAPYDEPIQARHITVDTSQDIQPAVEEVARLAAYVK